MLFGRYASRAFNFQKTLDNFYARQHKDGFICRELRETGPGEHFTRHDPSSTGPAILSWTEWEYYKTTAGWGCGNWALLAEIVPPERLERFVAHLDNEKEFKRPNRVPTLSADHPDYCPEGGYWCGSVWAPTNYMIMKGLEATGYDQLAHEIASAFVDHVTQVYQDTKTVWENYAPETPAPGLGAGRLASKDFVGWTGLAPIAVVYEYVMGIKGDPVHKKSVGMFDLQKHMVLLIILLVTAPFLFTATPESVQTTN